MRACALSMLVALCVGARAQDACPWLTQGTAAALMGGEVSLSSHVRAGEGTCEFLRMAKGDQSAAESLRMTITVSRLLPKACAIGEPLTGIGQDAVFCSTDVAGEHHDSIRGRVRGLYFLLTLAGKGAGTPANGLRRRSLEQATEEVAGNLF